MMVGLRVVLEGRNSSGTNRNNYYSNSSGSHQIVSKASMIITKTSPTSPTPKSPNPFSRKGYPFCNSTNSNFLDNCFLCRKKLLPSYDIYMYKGDKAFCSEECRSREIYMDEEKASAMKAKTKRGELCSLAAIKPQRQLASSSPSSPSSSRSSTKEDTKRSNGFVY